MDNDYLFTTPILHKALFDLAVSVLVFCPTQGVAHELFLRAADYFGKTDSENVGVLDRRIRFPELSHKSKLYPVTGPQVRFKTFAPRDFDNSHRGWKGVILLHPKTEFWSNEWAEKNFQTLQATNQRHPKLWRP